MPILIGMILMCISNFNISIFSFEFLDKSLNDWIIVIFIFLFIIGNFSSTGPIIPVYLPEIVQGQLIPICYWTFWFYSIIILLLFPIAREELGMEVVFAFFGLVTLIGAIVFKIYGVETLNKSNREIS